MTSFGALLLLLSKLKDTTLLEAVSLVSGMRSQTHLCNTSRRMQAETPLMKITCGITKQLSSSKKRVSTRTDFPSLGLEFWQIKRLKTLQETSTWWV